MKIGRRGLFCNILFIYCLAEGRFSPLNDHVNEGDLLADIVVKVLQASPTRDVLLILRDSPPDDRADDILGKISAATARRVPIFYVNARWAELEFQVSSWALSRDLLVYIYVSQREPDIVEGELIADDLRRFVYTHNRPKVLVLMILRQSSLDLEVFFQALWSRNILNVIVVGYHRSNEQSTTVHRYDPFTDSLTAEPYSANTTEWFTDDFPDMQGYPLLYLYLRRPPYSDTVLTSTGETWELKGVDLMTVQTLADKMNFNDIAKVLSHNVYFETHPNGTTTGILPDLISGRYDALFTTLPIFLDDEVQFTDTIHVETWCFVVPRLPVQKNFFAFSDTGIRLFITSFSIIGISWLCAKFMKLDPNRWHPLSIIGIMLASSFPPAPTRIHERIVFLSIFAACARYSSSFFGELTSLSLESNHHVRFDCLSDLINSDLTLMIFSDMTDIVTQDEAFLESHDTDKKMKIMTRIGDCLEAMLMHQNVSCFMERGWAKLAVVNNMRDGQSMLRITKLCYLWLPTGYIFPKGSPYINRVNDLLLMLKESGIRDMWQRVYLRNETRETSENNMVNHDRMNFTYVGVFQPMLSVLKFGYFISILVFFGELIWGQLHVELRLF